MAITYTWTITSLACLPTAGSLTDYVVVADWTCTGTDGTYSGSLSNMVTFTVDPYKTDYVPYPDLTEDEVIEWTQAALGPDILQSVYAAINAQIETQISPTIITPPLPWEPA